jgi:hypothetical protein
VPCDREFLFGGSKIISFFGPRDDFFQTLTALFQEGSELRIGGRLFGQQQLICLDHINAGAAASAQLAYKSSGFGPILHQRDELHAGILQFGYIGGALLADTIDGTMIGTDASHLHLVDKCKDFVEIFVVVDEELAEKIYFFVRNVLRAQVVFDPRPVLDDLDKLLKDF